MIKNQLKWLVGVTGAISTLLIVTASVIFVFPVQAATGINEQINYQGRLLANTGAVVPDGSYNVRFKIYCGGDGVLDGSTGTAANCNHITDEDLLWTETRESGNKMLVKNGYFSVYLGSVTAFGSSVNWNDDKLWLSIDIGGTASPAYDGEMSPFTRFSSSPYALNAGKLDGLDASDFLQLTGGAGAGLVLSGSAVDVNVSNGLEINSDAVRVNQNYSFGWTADQTWTLAGAENLDFTHDLTGSVNVLSLVGTPSASAGTAYGLFIQQANSANANGFDAGLVFDNADTNLAVADGLLITSAAGGITDALDLSDADIVNALNVGQNFILGDGVQMSSAAGVWTLEDTSGNDFITVTDNGATGNVDLSGSVAIGNNADIPASAGLGVNQLFLGNNCFFGCYSGIFDVTADNVTVGSTVAVYGRSTTAATAFTLPSSYAFYAAPAVLGTGSVITDNYGMYIGNQTAGDNDYGLYIAGADTAELAFGDTSAIVRLAGTDDSSALSITDSAASPNTIFRVGETATDNFSKARVSIGGAGNGLDQLYVNGRINTVYQQVWADCLLNAGTLTTASSTLYGAAFNLSTTSGARIVYGGSSGVSGVCRQNYGTAAANGTGYFGSNSAAATQRSLNPVLEARVLSDSNTDHRGIVGFTDIAQTTAVSTDTNQSANEAFFRKQASSTSWEAVSRSASGAEQITTSVGSTNAYHTLRIELDDAAAAVRFYVDGTLVATHTTAVPASAAQLGFAVINNVTGTTSRNQDIDFLRVWSDDPPLATGFAEEAPDVDGLAFEGGSPPEPEVLDALSQFLASVDGEQLETDRDLVVHGTLVADKIVANQIEGLEILTDKISNLSDAIETSNGEEEGQVAGQATKEAQGSSEAILPSEFGSITIQTATVALDLNVIGMLTASGGLVVDGDAIFNGLVAFNGRTTFNNDTAGFATIHAGQKEVEVRFSKPYESLPVVTVSVKNGVFTQHTYKDLTTGGFRIILSEAATEDVEFAWTALSVKDARISQNTAPVLP